MYIIRPDKHTHTWNRSLFETSSFVINLFPEILCPGFEGLDRRILHAFFIPFLSDFDFPWKPGKIIVIIHSYVGF